MPFRRLQALWSTLVAACSSSADPHPRAGDPVLGFLRENPERTALVVNHDDSVLVRYQAERPMPLASTVKIIVALEYARQAAAGEIGPEERVRLSELERFHLRGSDGGAHPAWLSTLNGAADASLREVAEGMILQSSNANTEYLMARLGLERVNRVLEDFGLSSHETLYPFSSILPMLQPPKGVSPSEWAVQLRSIPREEWVREATELHRRLRGPEGDSIRSAFSVMRLPMEVQRVWSDRLPAASADDYARLVGLISRREFPEAVHRHLDPVLEVFMRDSANRLRFRHAGGKGGRTAFVLTMAEYFEETDGTRTSYALFFNDLTSRESRRILAGLNDFRLRLLGSTELREQLRALR